MLVSDLQQIAALMGEPLQWCRGVHRTLVSPDDLVVAVQVDDSHLTKVTPDMAINSQILQMSACRSPIFDHLSVAQAPPSTSAGPDPMTPRSRSTSSFLKCSLNQARH